MDWFRKSNRSHLVSVSCTNWDPAQQCDVPSEIISIGVFTPAGSMVWTTTTDLAKVREIQLALTADYLAALADYFDWIYNRDMPNKKKKEIRMPQLSISLDDLDL